MRKRPGLFERLLGAYWPVLVIFGVCGLVLWAGKP
jgi:hypothetical protein